MGSSVVCGMEYLLKHHTDLTAVILMVCDQYLLSLKNIKALIKAFKRTNKKIVASKYGDAIGVPVLISNFFFPELLALNGKAGAKKIIQQYMDDTAIVEFADGIYDLDTENDLKNLF